MLKKKALIVSLISVVIVLSMISTVNAQPNNNNKSPAALGVGNFVHEHEGTPHNHYFAFKVSDGILKEDGWRYNPDGKFYMLATHEKEIHMVVKSEQIQRFKVMTVDGGLSVVFEGIAAVKHMDVDWEENWKFTVEAFDFGSNSADSIHIMLTAPDGNQHHMEGTLTFGNIVIKN